MSALTRRGALSVIAGSGVALVATPPLAGPLDANVDAELFRLADAYFVANKRHCEADVAWSERYYARPLVTLPPKPERAEYPPDLRDALEQMRTVDWRDPNHPAMLRSAELEAAHKLKVAAWEAECTALRPPDKGLSAILHASNETGDAACEAYYAALRCPARTLPGARLKVRLLDEPYDPEADDLRSVIAELAALLLEDGDGVPSL